MTTTQVAIVGAGIAGLSCAQVLHDHHWHVTVFDKGRAPGGRASTRRNALAFDHGAQYFTVTDDEFAETVASWRQRGVVAAWQARVVAIDRVGVLSASSPRQRLVGVPDMDAIAAHMARGLDVRCGVTVAPPRRDQRRWTLADVEGHALGFFDALVVTAPPAQSAALLEGHPLADVIALAEMAPCMAVMAAWDDPLELDFDAAFVNVGPLAWVARNGSKPGRRHACSWVLHASHSWSAEHLEQSPDEVVSPLLEAFAEAVGRELPAPSHAAGHRWRYALPTHPLDTPCLFDETHAIAVAGDWCGGPRVEGAWLSGRAAARRMLDAGDADTNHSRVVL